MDEAVATIIAEMGGEILRPDDPRRPKGLKLAPSDGLVLVPTASSQFPNLIAHFNETFPHAPPDIYVPGDQQLTLTPHVGLSGLVCSHSYRVYCNSSKPKDVLERAVREAVAMLEHNYSDDEKRQHFLAEAQAYWVTDDATRLHYLPNVCADTFVFQCSEQVCGLAKEFNVLDAAPLGANPGIIGFRIDVPNEQIKSFLESPEQWLQQDAAAQDVVLKGIDAMTRHHHRPRKAELVLAFRIRVEAGDIILAAKSVRKLKLHKFTKHNTAEWGQLFNEQINELRRIASEDISSRRIVRRASGRSDAQDAKFAAAAATRLAIVGCGSMGSHIFDLVLQGGIQNMYLLDKERLMPENLARHTLPSTYLYHPKIEGLLEKARRTYTEFNGTGWIGDILLPDVQNRVLDWGPSLVLCAAADQAVEMLLSNLVLNGSLPGAWYCWVEPHLAAGHLVYQPARFGRGLIDLYDETADDWFYRHRVLNDEAGAVEREAGCQTAFTPFSGAEAALFSAMCARKILDCIDSPTKELTAYRWVPGSGELEVMP